MFRLAKESITQLPVFAGDKKKLSEEERINRRMARKSRQILVQDQIKIRRQRLRDELFSNICLHGLRYVGETQGLRRYVWIIIVTLAISASFVLMFYNTFLSMQMSVTEFAVERNLNELPFPTITVCNANSPVFSMQAFKDFPLHKIIPNFTLQHFIWFYNMILSRRSPKLQKDKRFEALAKQMNAELPQMIGLFNSLNYTTYKEVQLLFEIHKEEEIFDDVVNVMASQFKCNFDNKPCSLKNFKLTVHWEFSVCHQFNPFIPGNASRTTTKYGYPYGLMMVSDTTGHSFFPDVPVTGLVFFIHPYGVPHYLIKDTVTILAKPGSWTQIEIQMTEVSRLGKPYENPCGEVPYVMVKRSSNPYYKATCELDIILQKIYAECKCVGWEWEGSLVDGIKICTVSQIMCYFSARKKALEEKDKGSDLKKKCPKECKTTKYSVVTSELGFGDPDVYRKIMNNVTGFNKTYDETKEYVRENIVGARIGYSSLSKRVEVYKPAVEWFEIIGTVGGSVSLCTGFSLITLFELLFFFIDYFGSPSYVRLRVRKQMKMSKASTATGM